MCVSVGFRWPLVVWGPVADGEESGLVIGSWLASYRGTSLQLCSFAGKSHTCGAVPPPLSHGFKAVAECPLEE